MSKNTENGLIETIKKSMVCAIVGIIITMLIIFGFSIMMSSGAGLLQLKSQYIIVSVIVGAIIAGLICTKNKKRGVVKGGFITGVCYVFLLIMIGILVPKVDSQDSILLKNIIAALCGACCGGTLRLYKKNKKAKLRRS